MVAGPSAIRRRPFYFMRHGEADWNVQRLCIGQLDRPLTPRGREQAEEARRHCENLEISAVFHSPLSRAAETARLAMHGRSIAMSVEHGLIEACLGVKQGAREDDAGDPFIVDWIGGAAIELAETYPNFQTRVCAAVNRCLDDAAPSGIPLLVAHAGVYHSLREIMKEPVGRVLHCMPYFHCPDEAGWRIEVTA